jgi:hypothetical protein
MIFLLASFQPLNSLYVSATIKGLKKMLDWES